VREHLRERHPWPDGQRTDVILCLETVVSVKDDKVFKRTTYPG
jgi:hypothetical protein